MATGATEPPAAGPDAPAAPAPAVPAASAGMRQVVQMLRRPARRLGAADFSRLSSTSVAFLGDPRIGPAVATGRRWADGGLAYVQGREAEWQEARRALAADAAGSGTPVPWGIGWPLLAFAREEWGAAALWADPRGELEGLLRPHLGALASQPRAALAAAYLAHLDGDHQGAIQLLAEAGMDPAAGGLAPDTRSLLAQFLAAEELETGDAAGSRTMRALALEGGGAPLALPFLLEMWALAGERVGVAEAVAVRAEACRHGVLQACPQGVQRRAQDGGRRVVPGEAAPRDLPKRVPARRRRPPGEAQD
jgi:hypothetical protein